MKMGPTSEKQNNPQNHNTEIRHGSNNTNVCEWNTNIPKAKYGFQMCG